MDHWRFVLLSCLLCCANAISLTYPIKGAFVGWEGIDWAVPGSVITNAASAGYNMLIFSFYSDKANEMVGAWDTMSEPNKQYYLDYAHQNGMAILLGVWVDTQFGDIIDYPNATDLGIQAAGWVKARNFDGVDIRIRGNKAGFLLGSRNGNDSINWVVDLTVALRQTLGPDAIITHSPSATDFGPLGGSGPAGPYGGYTTIHKRIGNMIQHYNVYYFSAGDYCYVNYDSLFVTSPSSCTAGTTVLEISRNANINISRLVVTKPIQKYQAPAGFLQPSDLRWALSQAYGIIGWNAGVTGWTWNNTGNFSVNWVPGIYPLVNVTPTPPPPTVATTTTSATITSTSTTSLPTGSPPLTSSSSGNPITSECGTPGNKPCRDNNIVIIAIIVPLVVVIVVIVLIVVFLYTRRKRQTLGGLSRLPSQTISNAELESSYQSTNLITDYGSIVVKSRLGQGGSGVVNMGVWRHIEVAVKEFTNQDIQTTDFIRESEIHAKLRHPNVVQLLAICLPPHMCTISEFMAKGSLADVLQQKPTAFTWKRKLQSLHDIAKGMDYLHKSKIIHRDLKSQNCLIDKNWNSKIADFGTSKLVNEKNSTATAYVPRTAQWSAPEVITAGAYSEMSDVYSYGVIMWECLTGEVPYDGMFAFQVEDSTVKGSRLPIPEGCDAWFAELMQECWSANAAARPTFETIIACMEKAIANVH